MTTDSRVVSLVERRNQRDDELQARLLEAYNDGKSRGSGPGTSRDQLHRFLAREEG
ncbi:MAG: hypothetical protein Q7L55_05400 [Actinomycetota bacterium]|nr:hypothetical protein [Actinomycetota bacterium]